MAKYTVNDYAKMVNRSVQSIYGKINRNSIDFVVEDGVKYVIDDTLNIEEDTAPAAANIKENDYELINTLYKLQKKENKKLNIGAAKLNKKLEKALKKNEKLLNTIEGLNKRLNNEKDKSIDILMQYINETKKLSAPTVEEDMIINDIKSKKKKKKKK